MSSGAGPSRLGGLLATMVRGRFPWPPSRSLPLRRTDRRSARPGAHRQRAGRRDVVIVAAVGCLSSLPICASTVSITFPADCSAWCTRTSHNALLYASHTPRARHGICCPHGTAVPRRVHCAARREPLVSSRRRTIPPSSLTPRWPPPDPPSRMETRIADKQALTQPSQVPHGSAFFVV